MRLPKRALMHDVFLGLSYKKAQGPQDASILPTVKERRERLTAKSFREAVQKEGYKLHKLLPPKNSCTIILRFKQRLKIFEDWHSLSRCPGVTNR